MVWRRFPWECCSENPCKLLPPWLCPAGLAWSRYWAPPGEPSQSLDAPAHLCALGFPSTGISPSLLFLGRGLIFYESWWTLPVAAVLPGLAVAPKGWQLPPRQSSPNQPAGNSGKPRVGSLVSLPSTLCSFSAMWPPCVQAGLLQTQVHQICQGWPFTGPTQSPDLS